MASNPMLLSRDIQVIEKELQTHSYSWHAPDFELIADPSEWSDPSARLDPRPPPRVGGLRASDAEIRELRATIGALADVDQKMLWMLGLGRGQRDIGDLLGISQPSVCARAKVIRAWLAWVIPAKAQSRGHALPGWVADPILRQMWNKAIWQHEALALIARDLGQTQGRMRYHMLSITHKLQDHPLQAVGAKWRENPATWIKPRVESHRRLGALRQL